MAKKKAPNWAEIEARFVDGWEKPAEIAKDYNVTARTISNAAYEGGWQEKRVNSGKDLISSYKALTEEISLLALTDIRDCLKAIKEARERGEIGVTVQDGEGPASKYTENGQKAGHEFAKHLLKAEEPSNQAPPTVTTVINGVNNDAV